MTVATPTPAATPADTSLAPAPDHPLRRALTNGKVLVGGFLLLTASFVLCLDASVRAFGGELSLASVAVVFLAGNALGSAAPTPGGVGAVELALASGLTAVGMDFDTALMFREDPVEGGIIYGENGRITVPETPGLGASIQPAWLEKMEKAII